MRCQESARLKTENLLGQKDIKFQSKLIDLNGMKEVIVNRRSDLGGGGGTSFFVEAVRLLCLIIARLFIICQKQQQLRFSHAGFRGRVSGLLCTSCVWDLSPFSLYSHVKFANKFAMTVLYRVDAAVSS